MSTITKEFTKEQLIQKLKHRISVASGFPDSEKAKMDLELARIALESLEADVVAWTDEQELRDVEKYGCGYLFTANPVTPNADPHRVIKLYAAPPVPVSVPDEATPDNIQMLASTFAPCGVTYQWDRDECNAAADSWNACRAAMLQGADDVGSWNNNKNTPSLREAVGAIRNSGIAIDAEKILAERDALNSPVIPDGWVMVPVDPTAAMISSGIAAHFERSQTQIHDRPAPGPMECAYVAMLAAAPQQEA